MENSPPPPDFADGQYRRPLSESDHGGIIAEFEKLGVGPVVFAGILGENDMTREALHRIVSAYNQKNASGAAGTPAPTWKAYRAVIWRGCWAIVRRDKKNKRRTTYWEAQPDPAGTATDYYANFVRTVITKASPGRVPAQGFPLFGMKTSLRMEETFDIDHSYPGLDLLQQKAAMAYQRSLYPALKNRATKPKRDAAKVKAKRKAKKQARRRQR